MASVLNSVSTYQANLASRRLVARIDSAAREAGKEATTGLRADVFRSLGIRSAESLALRGIMQQNQAFITANRRTESQLDLTGLTLQAARVTAEGFLEKAVPNSLSATAAVNTLQEAARAALEEFSSQLNTSYNGAYLFAGVDTAGPPLQQWREVNPGSGLSPAGVVGGIIGGGITSVADAAAKADELRQAFADADAAQPARNFEETFYNGSKRLDAAGQPNPRSVARIDEAQTLDYGIQANDQGFRDILRGLSMLAETDVSKITDDAAYAEWVGAAVTAVSNGVAGIRDTEVRLAFQQQRLQAALTRQEGQDDLYSSRVLALEGVDTYEAASRMTQLQSQLEATYAVTARLAGLTFLKYM